MSCRSTLFLYDERRTSQFHWHLLWRQNIGRFLLISALKWSSSMLRFFSPSHRVIFVCRLRRSLIESLHDIFYLWMTKLGGVFSRPCPPLTLTDSSPPQLISPPKKTFSQCTKMCTLSESISHPSQTTVMLHLAHLYVSISFDTWLVSLSLLDDQWWSKLCIHFSSTSSIIIQKWYECLIFLER